MKKLRIAVIALGLLICSSLPAKKARAGSGQWLVNYYSFTHWLCLSGGTACCPGIGC
jgi:hypothetical protein